MIQDITYPNVHFRIATKHDALAIATVHYQSWIETYSGLLSEDYLKTQSIEKRVLMFEQSECKNICVAVSNGKVIGFISIGPVRDDDLTNTMEILAMYVLKEYQHKGVGKYLLLFAQHTYLTADIIKLSLWVLNNNDRAIQFYEKCGFAKDGTQKNMMLGAPVFVIRMIKLLQ